MQISYDEAKKAVDSGKRVRQTYCNGKLWIEYFTRDGILMVSGSDGGEWKNANAPETILYCDSDVYELIPE